MFSARTMVAGSGWRMMFMTPPRRGSSAGAPVRERASVGAALSIRPGEAKDAAAGRARGGERCRRGRGPGYEVTTIEQVMNHGVPRLALKEFAKEGSVGSTVPAAVPNT